MDIRATFTIQLPVIFTDRGKWVLASCPVLDISSQGKDRDSAEKNLIEALELFLISCYERGVLDEVLKQCGFRPLQAGEKAQKSRIRDVVKLSIPLSVFVERGDEVACHA